MLKKSLFEHIDGIVERCNQDAATPFSGAIRVRALEQQVEKGIGDAIRSERIPNLPDTRFGIASGCKIFTAVAICQLVGQGRLSFDDRLCNILDFDFPHFDPAVTVHHLLTHNSGVPDYFNEEVMDDFSELWKTMPSYMMQSPADFLPMFQNRAMTFSPGEKFSYNNSGFILLGLIVEKISGMAFTSYVEEYIFRACGMEVSGYFRLDRLPERTAIGYMDAEDGWRTNHFALPIVGGPDGGAFTTARDLEKFWDALLECKLMLKEMTALMLTPHITVNERTRYGYGIWMTYIEGELFKYYVMGSDPGVTMVSSAYAKSGYRAHVLGNVDRGADAIASKIDELIFGRHI